MDCVHIDTSYLNEPKKLGWKYLWVLIISLPDYVSWNVFILLTTVFNYLLVIVHFTVCEEYLWDLLPLYMIFDIIYLVNCLMLIGQRIFQIPSLIRPKFINIVIVIDVLSLLPQVSLLLPYFDLNSVYLIPFIRITTFVRLRHLLVFKKILGAVTEHRMTWYLIEYMTYMLLVLHTVICLWFLTENSDDASKQQVSPSSLDWYWYYVYGFIQIALNVGFGDMYPMNLKQLYLFIAMLMAGQILNIWLIANLVWYLVYKYLHLQNTYQKIQFVNKYVNDDDLVTQWIVDKYYTLDRCKEIGTTSLMTRLHPSIKEEVDYDLNCGLLYRTKLLSDLPKHILKRISTVMKTVIVPTGENIYSQFVVKNSMICVQDGVLKILSNEDDESPIVYFKKGTILGESALFLNLPSKATVKAAVKTELRILDKTDFMKVMLPFPYYRKLLQRNMKLRLIALKESQKKRPTRNRTPNLRKIKDQLSISSTDRNTGNFYDMYNLVPSFIDKRLSLRTAILLTSWRLINGSFQVIFSLVYTHFVVFERYVPKYLLIIAIGSDVACILDIIINFKFYKKADGEVDTNYLHILDYYVDDWKFNLNLLSIFPAEVWSNVYPNKRTTSSRLFNILKLNRALRLHNVFQLEEILNKKDLSPMARKSLHTLLFMAIALYYSCCVLHLNSEINEDKHWHTPHSHEGHPKAQNQKQHGFIVSFYYTTTTAFGTGLGDILPETPTDYFIVTVVITLFFILKCYCLGQLIALKLSNVICNGYLETKWYFKNFLDFYEATKNIKRKIINYFNLDPWFYREKCKDFIRETEAHNIDTNVHQASEIGLLHDSFLFQKVDRYFLAIMEREVRCWLIPKNEILYKYGDPTRTMFIIQKGFCKLLSSNLTPEITVGPGKYLGFLETMYCLPKKHTVATITDCQLLCIDFPLLDRALKMFPKDMQCLEKTKYDVKILENIVNIDKLDSEPHETSEPQVKEYGFINISKTRPDYYKVFKEKLGIFWFCNFIFLPATINPEGLFIKIWCIIRAILIILQGIVLMVVIILPPFAHEVTWIDLAAQITLYIEMYLNFHIGYYDKKGTLKMHPAFTSWHYFTHSFLLDLISAIPWQRIMFHVFPPHDGNRLIDIVSSHNHHCLWNLIKLIQFYKVYKCFDYFQNYNVIFNATLKLLKFLFFLILLINFATSFGISYICHYIFDEHVPNILFRDDRGVPITGIIECHDGFLKPGWSSETFPDINEVYGNGIYFIVNLITNAGIGDIMAYTIPVKLLTSIIVILGYLLFVVITIVICSLMINESDEVLHFRDNMAKVYKFLDNNHIHSELKKKVINHFKLMWKRSNGFSINAHNNILKDTYLNDILIMERNKPVQTNIPIFPNNNVELLKIILGYVKVIYIQKGDTIIRHKDIISDMFIIASGQVDIFDSKHVLINTIGPAGVFGNIRKNLYSASEIYVEATKNVELWVLSTEDFLSTVKYYPTAIKDLETYFDNDPNYLKPLETHQFDFFYSIKENFDDLESDEELPIQPSSVESFIYIFLNLFIPTKWLKFAIRPDHNIFKIIEFLTFIASLLNVITIPYIFASQDSGILGYIYLSLEPIFYLRIFLKLHKGHVNSYGNLITCNTRLCQKYINTPAEMFWDIVPNLPIELIRFNFPRGEWHFYYTCFRLFHLLRYYYVVSYLKSQIKKLHRSAHWYFASVVINYSLLIHYLGCVWFLLVCPFNNCRTESLFIHFSRNTLNNLNINKLLMCYYYVLNILTSTGIGDVSPNTYWEMFFTLVTLLVGKIIIAFAIGAVLKMICISQRNLLIFNMKYNLLRKYFKEQEISDYPMVKASDYLKKIWNHTEGSMENEIFENLSYSLKQDVAFTLYGYQLRHTFIFQNADQRLLRQVCTKLRRMVYFQDDYIVKSGEINPTMYFIYKGDVCVSSKNPGNFENKHVILHYRDMFGVSQGLKLEIHHKFCYKAYTPVVELLALNFEDWSYLLEFFPREKQEIFVNVKKEYNMV